jgi:uncharacterized cupin superfamily protein
MFEFLVPAGAQVPVPHSHEAFDETVYGLDGVTTWVLEGQQVRVGQATSSSSLAGTCTTSQTSTRRTPGSSA